MRTTVSIEDELFEKAVQFCPPDSDNATVIREAIKVFVKVQAAKRLAALGGQAPDMKPIKRRS
jgi:hypothetical protein